MWWHIVVTVVLLFCGWLLSKSNHFVILEDYASHWSGQVLGLSRQKGFMAEEHWLWLSVTAGALLINPFCLERPKTCPLQTNHHPNVNQFRSKPDQAQLIRQWSALIGILDQCHDLMILICIWTLIQGVLILERLCKHRISRHSFIGPTVHRWPPTMQLFFLDHGISRANFA